MHYDGNGNAIRDTNWQQDAANGVPISAPEMDTEFNGVATCLSTCMTRNGQSAATADIPMGAHKVTGLANGTTLTDAVNYSQLQGAGIGYNYLVNPSFRFWQRYANGESGTASVTGATQGQYTADRWWATRDTIQAGYTISQSLPVFGAGNPGVAAMKIQRTAGNTSLVNLSVGQSVDANDVAAVVQSARKLALTAYIKKGANLTATLTFGIYTATTATTRADPNSGTWTLLASSTFTAANLTTGFVRYVATAGVVPINCGAIMVAFTLSGFTGTAGADDSITVGAVKLEPVDNSVATGFTGTPYIEPPYADSLLRCQRFYFKTFNPDVAPAQNAGTTGSLGYKVQVASTTAGWMGQIDLPVLLQGNPPTITTYNPSAANANWRNVTGSADSGVATITTVQRRYIEITNPQVAGDAAGNVVRIHASVDADY